MAELPRGIRNHNPGNIDRGRDRWRGMAEDQSGDGRFVVFEAPEWGIRAIVRVLRSYRDRHGLRTVAGIVGRWAPPAENPTARYVAFVCDRLGVGPDEPVDLDDPRVLRALARAIVRKECGPGPLADGDWYPDEVLDEGIRRADG
ncbi:structural protein [Stella sp.]|uniref:structural protein n=1 Tax=Stella sp. TaxID=2912054 RepID=UPI0035AD7FDC